MLGKLIKHEFKATGRFFLPMYVFIIILTPIFSLSIRMLNDSDSVDTYSVGSAMSTLLGFGGISGFVIMMMGIFMATFILIVLRFYRTTATSEAYLTFTLPVNAWEIVFSKTLCGFIWEICTGILAGAAILCMTFISGLWSVQDFLKSMSDFLSNFQTFFGLDPSDILSLVLILIAGLLGVLASLGKIFLSISLGQLFNNHRILISIGFYLAVYVALRFVGSMTSLPLLMIESDSMDTSNYYLNILYSITAVQNLIIAVVCFIITTIILKKHLNVR